MIDQRPQYGEFATPEEQRRLAGLPPLDAQGSPSPIGHADAQGAEPAVTKAPVKPRRWDRIVTIALLAYGLFNVFITAIAYLDLPRGMNDSMKMLGMAGEFTNYAQGRLWGAIAAALLVLGWVITAWLSVKRLRTGKLTWWVPIVGAVVTMIVVGICITVPMVNDPAFIEYVRGASAP